LVKSVRQQFDRQHKGTKFWCQTLLLITTLSSGNIVLGADIFAGKTLYAEFCAQCHGDRGIGNIPNTPDFRRGEGLLQSDADLLLHIREGRKSMPAFRGLLSDSEILDIVTYLRTFF